MSKKEKVNRKKHSLKRELTSIYVIVMAATLFACWLVNNLFLEKYYVHNKESMMLNTYSDIKEECLKDNMNSAEFDLTLERLCGTHNISIMLLNNSGWIKIYATEPKEQIIEELQKNLRGLLSTDRIIERNDDYILIQRRDTRIQTDYLEMWGMFPDGSFFLMRTALESIKVSADIANRFLLYVGLGGIIISGIVIYIVSRRVSDLEDANAALVKENEVKTQIDVMRKEFISNVSHELKTPIALIQGYAEGLKEGVNEEEERDYYCDVIMDESAKMNTMVKKLLTLNQLESGADILQKENFNLSLLVKNYVQASELLATQNGISVEVDVARDYFVNADEFKIEEVVTNLFSNAVNHCKGESQKQIRVSVSMEDDNVKVSVYNTGDRIPEESLTRIWEKFYKVDKARTREYGGSGIGLSIVKAIMEAHNGEYGVDNNIDGVTFWIKLRSAEVN